MKLQPLFEAEYRYESALDPVVLRAGGAPAQFLAEGSGRVWGALEGQVEWINAPALSEDGVLSPNVRGLIKLRGGGRVRYDTQGVSLPIDEERASLRRFVCSVRFYTKAAGLEHLNRAVAVEEGVIDLSVGELRSAVFTVVHTLRLGGG